MPPDDVPLALWVLPPATDPLLATLARAIEDYSRRGDTVALYRTRTTGSTNGRRLVPLSRGTEAALVVAIGSPRYFPWSIARRVLSHGGPLVAITETPSVWASVGANEGYGYLQHVVAFPEPPARMSGRTPVSTHKRVHHDVAVLIAAGSDA